MPAFRVQDLLKEEQEGHIDQVRRDGPFSGLCRGQAGKMLFNVAGQLLKEIGGPDLVKSGSEKAADGRQRGRHEDIHQDAQEKIAGEIFQERIDERQPGAN